jgi:hypothetical protein
VELTQVLRDLSDEDFHRVLPQIVAARVLPRMLALPDDQLREVLAAALMARGPDESGSLERRLFLGVVGPAPKRGRPAWRHSAVAVAAGSTDDGTGLTFAGSCPSCGTLLRCGASEVTCPVCRTARIRLTS